MSPGEGAMAFPEMGGTWACRARQEQRGAGAHLKVGTSGMCLCDPDRRGWVLGLRGSHWRREDTPMGARRPGFYT